ncbi:MAG TPA: serine/threonine-protein kinase [Kofleriaceae bacterium]|nr:serine/threonine-protein kinase [Kofleriaceae bacterium]
MVGVVIGSYQLVRKLGEGGMGAVYLGQHQLLGRRAAIKVLLPELSARPDIVNRFFNEARAVTSISDPGIVQVFDFGYHTDGSAFIVMEYLEGEPLDRRLARFGRIAAPEALRLARQVATSLAAAHAQQIVHRDLKPENIFLVHDAEVASGERSKILDFGIAKLSDNHPGKLKTHAGALMGTPVYMSPEQCRGLVEVDHRSDIYSLGCVLFHLLTGRPPFDGEAPGDIMSAHIREPAPVASSRAPEIAPSIDALVMRCLAKAPAERFQTMLELTAALGAVLQQLPGGGQVSGAPAYHMMPTTQVSLGGTPTPPPPHGGTPVPPVRTFVSSAESRAPVAPTTLGSSAGQFATGAPRQRRVGIWIAAGLVVAAVAGGIAIVGGKGSQAPRVAAVDNAGASAAGATGAGASGAGSSGLAAGNVAGAGAATGDGAAAAAAATGAGAGAAGAATGDGAAAAGAARGGDAAGAAAGSAARGGDAAGAAAGSAATGGDAAGAAAGSAATGGDAARAAAGSAAGAAAGSPASDGGAGTGRGSSKKPTHRKRPAGEAAASGRTEAAAPRATAPPSPSPAAVQTPAASAQKSPATPPATAQKPAASKCSKAGFAAIYNAAAPTKDAIRAAIRGLKECHTAGAIGDAEFEETQAALVARF